ncbi:MAG: serine/threonine-protein kinase, partial [Pseudomonadota bacterium]
IIHRDLKPENVMVTVDEDESEIIKIMDFGIAKVTFDDIPSTPLTTAGMVFGTPSYISPEQASGDPVDARSDLYSLGCMIFEMATGRTPYDSDTVGGILLSQMFPAGAAEDQERSFKKKSDGGFRIVFQSRLIPFERPWN